MAKIINEIPAELEEEETTEVELESSEDKADYEEAVEAKKEDKQEPEFEIEEEDDTPPEDRGRDPLPDKVKQELEEDNLEEYSSRVKERMAQLKKAWHDERRAKEALDRERAEAIKYAQTIISENQKLKKTLSTGEEDYLKTLKEKYESDVNYAKREYREAYDSGPASTTGFAHSSRRPRPPCSPLRWRARPSCWLSCTPEASTTVTSRRATWRGSPALRCSYSTTNACASACACRCAGA